MQRSTQKGARAVLALATATLCSTSCTSSGTTPVTTSARPTPSQSSAGTEPEPSPPPTSNDLRARARQVGANELGAIPVLMYHRVLRRPESDYDITPAAFLRELRRLHREGYRPITASDFVRGRIEVPAGKSPVVLTFDDSSREQFALRPDGSVDPHTAIGILLRFSRAHPDFEATGTLFVNTGSFGTSDGSSLLRELSRRGFELGNHTAHHADLSALSSKSVRRELVAGARLITSAVPGARVRTLALPLGRRPQKAKLAVRGSLGGRSYRHLGVFLVGAEPAPSPFSKLFRPAAIPRIRSSRWNGKVPNYGSEFWLDYLKDHPDERYVSDGDPGTIAFPRSSNELLGRVKGKDTLPY